MNTPARHDAGIAPLREEAERIAARLPPLLVQAERIAQTVAFGVHGRRVSGPGDTFWQFRRYQDEDSAALIDWRQSAKSQHVFVREREWEAAQTVWLWRASGEAMDYRSLPSLPSKAERASLLLMALAVLLVRGGEKIGMIALERESGSGRPGLRRVARALLDFAPSPVPDMPLSTHATGVIAGDFLEPPEVFSAWLARLAAKGARGAVLQIADPAEAEFPFKGRVRFEPWAGWPSHLVGRAEDVAPAYRARFAAHQDALRAAARRHGWLFFSHRTDQRPEQALMMLHLALGTGPRAAVHLAGR